MRQAAARLATPIRSNVAMSALPSPQRCTSTAPNRRDGAARLSIVGRHAAAWPPHRRFRAPTQLDTPNRRSTAAARSNPATRIGQATRFAGAASRINANAACRRLKRVAEMLCRLDPRRRPPPRRKRTGLLRRFRGWPRPFLRRVPKHIFPPSSFATGPMRRDPKTIETSSPRSPARPQFAN